MLEEHANVVKLISLAGEVKGRKKLQKMIYIAKKFDYPFQEKYHFHMYGPYSEELTLRVEELCTMGFLAERKEDKGAYEQYLYTATDKGNLFINGFSEQAEQLPKIIEALNGESSRFLELVSTLLYFDELERTQQMLKVQTVKAKLKFTEEEMAQAFELIEKLGTFKNC